ncbi:DNA binding domain-containing protein, excisionase family [Sporobacter termitidis DSM 10068]|uniref:DNA binding domain-containing protein, excisionase family n=1 Tax=Sporobacter termitidis DSM 10068 TaxID=1123282 RepID=A0A1M5U0V2_9FIRM|nr:helix-turn-helix domain-containing protein [Sporobacter termitidis]SHH56652.1 DNA binding domain-containing protein, excisionase family [Sporobacter termitidis DSM 10068]
MKKTTLTIDELYLSMFEQYEDILTVEEVAHMMRLDAKRVYRMIRSGELKSMNVERAIRVPKLWVIEYIQKYGFIRQEKIHRQRRAEVTVFCQTPKSRKQIQEFLDLADRKFFRDSVLHPLLEEGVLEMTIPNNPAHVKQCYIATKHLSSEENELE